MDVWLLRHAAAEERAESGRDRDRALTAEGLRRAENVGRGLAALEVSFAAIWTSPFRRARQTAEAAAKAFGRAAPLHATDALTPDRDPSDVLEELDSEGISGDVLIVGHEPHLGGLLGSLVAGGAAPIPLRKASVARVERTGRRSGVLRSLLPAPVLERLAARRG